jgi:hypothetical protein
LIDATALVSPLKLTVKGVGVQPGGCTNITWVLYIKDKKGKVLQYEIGQTDTTADPETTTDVLDPSEGGFLYEMGEWCAGGADYYQIKLSGDALTILYKGVGEGEDSGVDDKFETQYTIQLPPGAKLTTK